MTIRHVAMVAIICIVTMFGSAKVGAAWAGGGKKPPAPKHSSPPAQVDPPKTTSGGLFGHVKAEENEGSDDGSGSSADDPGNDPSSSHDGPDLSRSEGHVTTYTVPPCDPGEPRQCHRTPWCPDGTVGTVTETVPTGSLGANGPSVDDPDTHVQCGTTTSTTKQPVLTEGMIIEAFYRINLPASPLHIQPPGGKTLVNFDTIFYTNNAPKTYPVNVLGFHIEFRVTPSTYNWYWGDGDWHQTTDPGRPFTTKEAIADDITHRYLKKDVFYPHLDTVYTAIYRVNGGHWAPVPGSVTIEGDGVRLQTLTAHPVLTDPGCC